MKRIIYLSRATEQFDPHNGLEEILTTSRKNNAKRGVSGALVYASGNFLQLLEGPRAQIDEVFDIISKDTRHKDIHLLHETHIQEATSAGWWMANFNVDSRCLVSADLEQELIELLREGVEREPGHAHAIFETFIIKLNQMPADEHEKSPTSESLTGL